MSLIKLFHNDHLIFDSTECVVAGLQRRKKAAVKSQAFEVSVVMLEKLPRGKLLQKLASEGRIQTLQVTPIRSKN